MTYFYTHLKRFITPKRVPMIAALMGMLVYVYPSFAQQPFVNAATFTGGSYLQVPDNAAIQLFNNITIEAWVNPAGNRTTGTGVIVRKGLRGNANYFVNYDYDTETVRYGFSQGGTFFDFRAPLGVVPRGRWSHIAVVRNGAGGIFIYVNGVRVLFRITDRTPTAGEAADRVLNIGSVRPIVTNQDFDGQLDEIRIWNLERTETQIGASFTTEIASNTQGLAAYYSLNNTALPGINNSTSTATSTPASSLNATVNGTVTVATSTINQSSFPYAFIAATNFTEPNTVTVQVLTSMGGQSGTMTFESSTNGTAFNPIPNVERSVSGGVGLISQPLSVPVGSRFFIRPVLTVNQQSFRPRHRSIHGRIALSGNAYLESTDDANFRNTGDLTLEAWINPTTTIGTGIGTIITKGIVQQTTEYNLSYDYERQTILFIGRDDRRAYAEFNAVPAGVWSHVCAVRRLEGNSTRIELYANGKFIGSSVLPVPVVTGTNNRQFRIGNGFGGFVGGIDEVRVWSIARQFNPILRDLYLEYAPASVFGTPEGLLAYYSFNQELYFNETFSGASRQIFNNATIGSTEFLALTSFATTFTFENDRVQRNIIARAFLPFSSNPLMMESLGGEVISHGLNISYYLQVAPNSTFTGAQRIGELFQTNERFIPSVIEGEAIAPSSSPRFYRMVVEQNSSIAAVSPTRYLPGTVSPPNSVTLATGSYFFAYDHPALEIYDALTLQASIFPDSTRTTGIGVVMRKGQNVNLRYSIFYNYELQRVQFEWYDGAFKTIATPDGSVPRNRWSRISVVRSNTQEVKIYVDGVLRVTENATRPQVNFASNPQLNFGSARPGTTAQDYSGRLAHLQIYRRALSESEIIASIQSRYTTGQDTALVINYSFSTNWQDGAGRIIDNFATSTPDFPSLGMLNAITVGNDVTFGSANVPTLSVENEMAARPKDFALSQNYPNPFNPSTTIRYQIPVGGNVKLEVYDMLGRKVATLLNQRKDAGQYEVSFNASSLSSGAYFYRLQSGQFSKTLKMMLVK